MPGMNLIKTTNEVLIKRIIAKGIEPKHISRATGVKVWFFEIPDNLLTPNKSKGEAGLFDKKEEKEIVIAKQSEINDLINLPGTASPVKNYGSEILIAELEARGYKVTGKEAEKKVVKKVEKRRGRK